MSSAIERRKDALFTLADNTNSGKDELADLNVIPCSSASIIPHYKTLKTPLKKVDLAIAYYPRDKHKKGELQKLLRASPLSEEEQSINFTSYPGLTEGPIVLSVEIKRAGDGADAAKLQLLTWLSAQKNKIDELSSLTSSTSGIEKPDYLPAILVQGHDWNLVAFAMDAEGKQILWHKLPLGDTQTAMGVYRIIQQLQKLANITLVPFYQWYQGLRPALT
ncbi:uncharacterized protein B0I36DRAFT_396294 [Microdochium trichocladiopsis]|uniref:PD-(D/E)XK nuclease-like domain-containing protein n=1 Tax=Microdochium trichocladiopsis TaxID=1682393 RepID=A0A9P8XV43_9PEZI|nr:uncharacterized protein B0I36DRAFT_396294 [Microdochium trichocladiopsis]KAH7016212.1 hypothetical protein B0I36DRAFT_396294 [Microdochium trichocladiopsis]